MKTLVKALLACLLIFACSPGESLAAPKLKHAIVRAAQVATAPVVHPKRTLKQTLGSILFVVENGVDVTHAILAGADKAFDAISIQGQIPVLDAIYGFVSVANKDTGKLDAWLERQEDKLFGSHN